MYKYAPTLKARSAAMAIQLNPITLEEQSRISFTFSRYPYQQYATIHQQAMNSLPGPASLQGVAELSIIGNLTQAGRNWKDQDILYGVITFTSYRMGVIVTAKFKVISPADTNLYQNQPYINCLYSKNLGVSLFMGSNAGPVIEQILGITLTNKIDKFGLMNPLKSRENLDEVFSLIVSVEWLNPRNLSKGVRIYRWEVLERFLVELARYVVRVYFLLLY
jgi:hypothetical protein